MNAKNEEGKTPLHRAVFCETLETVEALIEAGAMVNARDKEGKTPLYWAAVFEDNPELVEVLIAKGAYVNSTVTDGPFKGWTPMDAGAYLGHKDTVKVLIKAEADVNTNPN